MDVQGSIIASHCRLRPHRITAMVLVRFYRIAILGNNLEILNNRFAFFPTRRTRHEKNSALCPRGPCTVGCATFVPPCFRGLSNFNFYAAYLSRLRCDNAWICHPQLFQNWTDTEQKA